MLVAITRACRDGERLQVRYRDGRGRATDRTLDPYRVVSTARRWYLVARDRDRDDWRTFRVDRIVDAATRPVTASPSTTRRTRWRSCRRRSRRRRTATRPASSSPRRSPSSTELVPPTVGVLEAIDDDRTMLTTGADDLDLLAFHLLSLGVDFRVLETDALREHLATAAERLANAVARAAVTSPA